MANNKKAPVKQEQKQFNGVDNLTDEQKALVKDSYTVSGKKIGAEIVVTGDIDTYSYEGNDYLAWLCEGGTKERPNLVTPRRLSDFTHFKDADWQWLDGKSADDAFVLESEDGDGQLVEMQDYLNEVEGNLTIIGKAKHPVFANNYIYAYE